MTALELAEALLALPPHQQNLPVLVWDDRADWWTHIVLMPPGEDTGYNCPTIEPGEPWDTRSL